MDTLLCRRECYAPSVFRDETLNCKGIEDGKNKVRAYAFIRDQTDKDSAGRV